jgi:hypothetical protein
MMIKGKYIGSNGATSVNTRVKEGWGLGNLEPSMRPC